MARDTSGEDRSGDPGAAGVQPRCKPSPAASELIAGLYQNLLVIARRVLWRFRGTTLLMSSSELIHESYLRLAENSEFTSPEHFLRLASVVMHRVLVDQLREQLAQKRGQGAVHAELDDIDGMTVDDDTMPMAVQQALDKLSVQSPRVAQVVHMRYFGGHEDQAIAAVLGVTERTVRRDWVLARDWLARELGEAPSASPAATRR